MVNKVFQPLIGKTIEVYVDEMLVKSLKRKDHVVNFRDYFELLCQYQMKLNTEKCMFGVASEKFLGYLVTQHGIEANPD